MLEIAFRLDDYNECLGDPIGLTAEVLATEDSRVAGAFEAGDDPAQRLIMVLGLDRWLQAPADQALLDLDVAVAYSHAGLAEHGAPLAQSRVDAVLAQVAEWLRLDALPAALASEASTVVRECEALLRLDDPRMARLLSQASELDGMRVTSSADVERLSHYAQPSPPRIRILAGVDRLQVPSRVLDLAQGYDLTVLQDEQEIEVSVPAFTRASRQIALGVRLIDRSMDEVISQEPLRLDLKRGRYIATVSLSRRLAPADVAVDVYDTRTGYDPRTHADDQPARAALADVQDAWTDHRRAVALHALGMPHEQALEDARGILSTTPSDAPEGLLAQREEITRRLAEPLPTSGPERASLAELAAAFRGDLG